MANKLCIFSYNSRGWGSQQQKMCQNMSKFCGDKIPVICNQENFILRNNSYMINKALPDYQIIFKPAIKDNLDKGRPMNGMFTAIPSTLKELITDVSPPNFRLQAVKIKSTVDILVISSYFPVDPRTIQFDDTELQEVLTGIKSIIEDNTFEHIIWCGDINTDFIRVTGHVNCVRQFVEEINLIKSWEIYDISYTCLHEINGITYTSKIDHFFWNQNLTPYIEDCGVIHDIDNTSDHCPIWCVINAASVPVTSHPVGPGKAKPSWKKSTIMEQNCYKNKLNLKLDSVQYPQNVHECLDTKCCNNDHLKQCDNYVNEVLNALETAAHESLHITKGNENKSKNDKFQKVIPGFDVVRPAKETAAFWHSIWVSCNKPINTELHQIMKRTRNIYHYELRKIKAAENKIKANKLLEASLNNGTDLFKQIKQLRKCKNNVANKIDGVSVNIPDHFANIYSALFNSTNDTENLQKVKIEIDKGINANSLVHVEKITPQIVKNAVKQLNSNKTDPKFDFSSDCFKNAPDQLFEHLANIFKIFLIHGHVSLFILLSTLVPLIKDKLGDHCASKNYRSIAISSLLLKIFDWVIILLFGEALMLDDLQFGYQAGCSTNMASWMVLENIRYFLRNGSEVFICLMDMTKAFDMVQHSLLFKKLLQSGLPPIVIRLLFFMYMNQKANVRWGETVSKYFTMSNGVKQGAVLSAILYCFYTNSLFNLLRRNKVGCWVQGKFTGAAGYADDNLLMSPTHNGLQEMMKMCEDFAKDHNLQFSTNPIVRKSKTKCVAFLKNNRILKPIKLNGNNLPWINSPETVIHLGNTIENCGNLLSRDVRIKRAKYINRNNELNQEFYFAHPESKIKINNIYNMSFSGSSLWDLFSNDVISLENSYNLSLKIMWDIPRETHRYFIEHLSDQKHIKFIFIKRFLRFIKQIEDSSKSAIKSLLSICKNDCRSITGKNLRQIMLMYDKESINSVEENEINSIEYFPTPVEEKWRIEMLKELLEARHSVMEIPGFSQAEITELIDHVCTS